MAGVYITVSWRWHRFDRELQNELFLEHVLAGIQWALQSGTTKAYNPNALVGNT